MDQVSEALLSGKDVVIAEGTTAPDQPVRDGRRRSAGSSTKTLVGIIDGNLHIRT
jgi:hypothetical protein